MMRLIEVIEGEETSEETLQAAANFAQAIRKTAVRCGEVPGLRGQPHPHLGDVGGLARDRGGEGLDVKEVDKVITGVGHGADGARSSSPTCSASTPCSTWREHLQRLLRRPLLRHARMKELVEAGNLGQKTGKGFYEHG